jgi:hypothetical protein
MFERYTEQARRVISFARFEASQFGSSTMESEHFLLGLFRDDEKRLEPLFPHSASIGAIRRQIEDQVTIHEKISTSFDIPFSDECQRILRHAAEESERLGHSHIDTVHLLLGMLRDGHCFAAKVLTGLGLELTTAREKIRRMPTTEYEAKGGRPLTSFSWAANPPLPTAGVVPDIDTAKRIAEAVWFPRTSAVHGEPIVAQTATLAAGVWIVMGTRSNISLSVFIQKADGKILRLHQETVNS